MKRGARYGCSTSRPGGEGAEARHAAAPRARPASSTADSRGRRTRTASGRVPGAPPPSSTARRSSQKERDAGLRRLDESSSGAASTFSNGGPPAPEEAAPSRNHHPTVKPVALMRWWFDWSPHPEGPSLTPSSAAEAPGLPAWRRGCDSSGWRGSRRTSSSPAGVSVTPGVGCPRLRAGGRQR